MKKKLLIALLTALCIVASTFGFTSVFASNEKYDGKTNLAIDSTLWNPSWFTNHYGFVTMDENGILFDSYGTDSACGAVSLKEGLPYNGKVSITFNSEATNANGFFKVILFMPQLLSGVVLGVLFKEIANGVYIKTLGGEGATGLLTNIDTKFGAVVFFNIIMSFGVNVLTYTSTMGGINESLIESAQLDGANALEEFFYIVFPMIYPTVTTLMIVGFSHIFTNQYNLYTLFGQSGNEVSTIGY